MTNLLVACILALTSCVPVIAADTSPEGIYIVPQSHIDVAWLWRYDPETIEFVIPSTFGLAVTDLNEFPDYSFSASQVPLFEGMRLHHRELAGQVEKLVRQGRFEIVGGHWVEFEGCGPCGEALVRQCVYGKQYFKRVYGVDLHNAWQPDSWTHPWTLPQILRKCEIDSYVFHRGAPGEDVFWWESADGSRVLACRPFHSGRPDLTAAIEYHNQIREKYGINVSMWRAGNGDHGGGWKPEDIRTLKRQMESSTTPARFSRADTFLAALKAQSTDLPVVRDELGFELEGCHANAGRLKAANRRCENLLIEAEKFSSIASRAAGLAYPRAELKSAWLDVLTNQFHDTISGCVVPAALEDAMALYARAEETARRVRGTALGHLAERIDTRGEGEPVVVFNSLSWRRTGPVEVIIHLLARTGYLSFTDSAGESVPGQIVEAQKRDGDWELRCVFVARDVPGIGHKTYWARLGRQSANSPAEDSPRVGDWQMDSDLFSLAIDRQTGDLIHITDKQRGVEVLPSGARGNEIQILEETGDSEGRLNWGKGRWSPDPLSPLNGWKVVENGPVRATVRIRNTWRECQVAFDRFITLYAGVPWIQFRTDIEWNSTGKMVKVAFPTLYDQARPTYDVPYGTIAREASGEERPALRWVNLGDDKGGVGLLNDCRYGHDVRDGVIRIDAIRSPLQPAANTDCGNQELTYALYPHASDWRAGRVMQRGYEFNNPLIGVAAEAHAGDLQPAHSFVRVERPNVILSVLKQAEDGGHLIARGYEVFGQQCQAGLEFEGLGVGKATMINMLEHPLSSATVETVSPGEAHVAVPFAAYEIVSVELE